MQFNQVANLSVNRTACKLRLQVPSALRAPAAGYLHVGPYEQLSLIGTQLDRIHCRTA